MDNFVVVVLDNRSVVPDAVHCFATLDKAKQFAETLAAGAKWEEWAKGKFVFGHGADEIDEPIAVVYGCG